MKTFTLSGHSLFSYIPFDKIPIPFDPDFPPYTHHGKIIHASYIQKEQQFYLTSPTQLSDHALVLLCPEHRQQLIRITSTSFSDFPSPFLSHSSNIHTKENTIRMWKPLSSDVIRLFVPDGFTSYFSNQVLLFCLPQDLSFRLEVTPIGMRSKAKEFFFRWDGTELYSVVNDSISNDIVSQ